MTRTAYRRIRRILPLAVTLLAGLTAVPAAAATPVDPALPVPTVASNQSCGTLTDPAWDLGDSFYLTPQGTTFRINEPQSAADATHYQGVVHAWDVDDPSAQADGAAGDPSMPYQAAYVPLPPVNGHTYAWTAQSYDGTSYSAATAPCYYRVDSTQPRILSITNPDYPLMDSYQKAHKASGVPTTFTFKVLDPLPAGCATAGGPGCQTSGVTSFRWSTDARTFLSSPVLLDDQGGGTVTITPTGGGHAFTVTTVDAAGNVGDATYSYFVPYQPAPFSTTVHLNAPASSGRGIPLTVSGSVQPGSYTAADLADRSRTNLVQVSRVDLAHPGGLALPDVALRPGGVFSFQDTPQVGGGNTYTVTYPGDYIQQPAHASATVQVSRLASALTLTAPAHGYAQGAAPTLTAHLGTTADGRVVSIYAQPVGSSRVLLKTGTVDAAGNLTVAYKLARSTVLTATYAGDHEYAPSTAALTLTATPTVAAGLRYSSGTVSVGRTVYQAFHRGQHQPVLQGRASLAQPGGCYRAEVEYWTGRIWHLVVNSPCLPVASNGYISYPVPWAALPTNGLFRTRLRYSPPATAAISTQAWSPQLYFTIKPH